MVGFEKGDKLTSNQKLVAGCVSGICTKFITQPLDIIKLRTQLQKAHGHKNAWWYTTKKIFTEEGITAFWHGHNLGQIHSVTAIGAQFYFYELSTKYVASSPLQNKDKNLINFFCGVFAGCCGSVLVSPFEVIRVRQMILKTKYKGLINGAKAVYNSGGILAFYEGLTAALLQVGPASGIAFASFKVVQPFLLTLLHDYHTKYKTQVTIPSNIEKPADVLLASAIAGTIAGFMSKSLTYPFDLAKRRMQISSHINDPQYPPPSTARHLISCNSLAACLHKTLKKEGFIGLYRGWNVTVYKAQLSSLLSFTTYELLCYAIQDVGV